MMQVRSLRISVVDLMRECHKDMMGGRRGK